MPSFQKLFEKVDGMTVQYKDKLLYLVDRFPVSYGDKLVISIEKTNSEYKQGIRIDILGKCEFNGEIFKRGTNVKMVFWEDLAPEQIFLKVYTREGFIWVQNIWEFTNHQGKKILGSGVNGAAMIIEELENGRRYRCNDGHSDENFDDIVFTVQKIKQ